MKKVIIHTDGSCLGNPGRGGWAAVLSLAGTEHRREISGGVRLTTNNRMELRAAIEALKTLKEPCEVELRTDSQYIIYGVKRNRVRYEAPNPDLWEIFYAAARQHRITPVWLRGHTGDRENERCDALAKAQAQRNGLPADTIYEELRRNRA